ncbi:MAG: PEP/pyruvate-binding domain-containing protein [Longimicrobiales bacterium]
MNRHDPDDPRIPRFDRAFFSSERTFTRIGDGRLGGKTEGLLSIKETLERIQEDGAFGPIRVGIPRLTVLATDVFDAFMQRNRLRDVALSGQADQRIAHAFQKADLPSEILGDLRGLIETVHTPLAVRSSSLLEDALGRPFAGVYETKMLPNNQPDAGSRFHRLVEAIKLIYASTFFRDARAYRRVAGVDDELEKMAVIIQEVVGERHGDRFYPHLSLVCRSYNYYPMGRARPDQGVVSLALGLGKTIVDGGVCWSYCPAYPTAPPPYGSVSQLLKESQNRFWAVNMGPPPEYDPIAETEYLMEGGLDDAEYDGTLRHLVSTYDPESDRLFPGMGNRGPRVLNFASLLQFGDIPVNPAVRKLLEACEEALGAKVEIELAMTLPGSGNDEARLGFLQVRPMLAPGTAVEIGPEEMSGPGVLIATGRAMGNGTVESVRDVVFTRPATFEARSTRVMAAQIERVNLRLLKEGRPYLLIGFGRWGSSDPWLGIPVTWSQVSGAKAIVEASLPSMNVEPSQGSHFFHNLSSFEVAYFTVGHGIGGGLIDWELLEGQVTLEETEFLRHVRFSEPLRIRLDGRTGRGVVEVPETREASSRIVEKVERS